VAANAFAGFGPAGLAAGLVAAAGIGLVGEELNKQNEAAIALKGYFSDAYQTAVEEGRKYIDQATILKEAQDIIFNPDRANEYKSIQEDAVKIGLDANTLIMARAGDTTALNTVITATGTAYDEVKRKSEEAGSTAIRLSADERREIDQIKRDYEGIGQLHDDNAARAEAAQEVKDRLHHEERAQIERTASADQARYEAMAARARAGVTIPVKLESNAAWAELNKLTSPKYVDMRVKPRGVAEWQ
jgi:hypothetical protein